MTYWERPMHKKCAHTTVRGMTADEGYTQLGRKPSTPFPLPLRTAVVIIIRERPEIRRSDGRRARALSGWGVATGETRAT